MGRRARNFDAYVENTRIIKWFESTKTYKWMEETWLMKKVVRKAEKYTLLAKPRYAIPIILIAKGVLQNGLVYVGGKEIFNSINDKQEEVIEQIDNTASPLERLIDEEGIIKQIQSELILKADGTIGRHIQNNYYSEPSEYFQR